MSAVRLLHLLGATGRTRTAMFQGREHLVVPVVALMEGVIHAVNASCPEFVPARALSVAPQSWDGRPLMLGHPARDGRQISANDVRVLETQSFGHVFNTRFDGRRLLMDAFIDPEKAERIGGGDMLTRLRNNELCEVSVGAFVTTNPTEGAFNGKPYKAVWNTISPDHLAFLPKGRGACSTEMGCGANRAAAEFVTDDGFRAATEAELAALESTMTVSQAVAALRAALEADSSPEAAQAAHDCMHALHVKAVELGADCQPTRVLEAAELETLGGKGSGNFGHKGRPGEVGGSSSDGSVSKFTGEVEGTRGQRLENGPSGRKFTGEVGVERSPKLAKWKEDGQWKTAPDLGLGFDVDDVPIGLLKNSALSLVAHGKVDLNQKAGHELASRGLDKSGTWVGYDRAEQIHGSDPKDKLPDGNPDPDREQIRGIMQIMNMEMLTAAVNGHLDLNKLAAKHMEGRGVNKSGKWVGPRSKVNERKPENMMKAVHGLFKRRGLAENEDAEESDEKDEADMDDCEECGGSGSKDGNPCEACEGTGEVPLKAAEEAEARHLSERRASIDMLIACQYCPFTEEDRAMLEQAPDERLESFKAAGQAKKTAAEAAQPQGETNMTAEQRAEIVRALMTNKYSGFTNGDERMLEAASDERLEAFRVASEARANEDQALRAAAAKQLTVEEFMAAAPPELKSLISRQQQQETTLKAALVTELRAAQSEYSEAELSVMPVADLTRMARLAKVDTAKIDFSGRGLPRSLASEEDDFTPPNPYEKGLKALQSVN